jgi:predicted nucleic acid-binding protein
MIVVSDTSPLNYLVLIRQVDVLPVLFDRVVTPPAVIAELLHPRSPAPVQAWAGALPAWLEIISPAATDQTLGLGTGEIEAIAVARELNASLLLVDERKATGIAARLGIQAVGTLNVLALAAERQLLDLRSAVAELRRTTFREPTSLVEELLRRDAARRGGA